MNTLIYISTEDIYCIVGLAEQGDYSKFLGHPFITQVLLLSIPFLLVSILLMVIFTGKELDELLSFPEV